MHSVNYCTHFSDFLLKLSFYARRKKNANVTKKRREHESKSGVCKEIERQKKKETFSYSLLCTHSFQCAQVELKKKFQCGSERKVCLKTIFFSLSQSP